MNEQPLFEHHDFNKRRANQLREEALEQVDAAAYEQWKQKARDCIHYCASTMAEFTTDECVALMENHYPTLTTHEPKAWGPLMTAAAKQGWIVNTKRVTNSSMTSNHARPKTVWKSLEYETH